MKKNTMCKKKYGEKYAEKYGGKYGFIHIMTCKKKTHLQMHSFFFLLGMRP